MKTRLIFRLFVAGLITFMFMSVNSLAQGDGEYHFITIDVDGLSRYYMLYEPEGHNGSDDWPLVFLFHGFGGTVNGINSNTEMYLVADTAKFLLVIPEGLVIHDLIFGGSATGWHVPGNYTASHDDIQFVNAIIDDLIDNPDFVIDTNRIHATGHSNGGEMSFYLACALSQKIASIGGVSAQMAYAMMDSICTPERQVSTLQMLGTEDPFFPQYGDETFPPLEGASEYWAGIDDCNASPTETELPDIYPNDNSTVTLLNYEACDFGFEVLCYRIENGGHCWPGGAGFCNNDINASVEVWNFFLRNPHPNAIPCYTNGIAFSTQSSVDNFQINYPYCIEIGGDVEISGGDITNLVGLSTLKVIGGDLQIHGNTSLMDLSGLNNLESINGDFIVNTNNNLEDFSGLEKLKSINGALKIYDNSSLSTLLGLDSIAHGSITDLTIAVNSNLSYCAIMSICEYLANPNSSIIIQDNAPGCESVEELYEICWTYVSENQNFSEVLIHPNPFTTSTTIEYELTQPSSIQVIIYDYLSKQIEVIEKKQAQGKQQIIWNAEGLPSGIYFCVVKTEYGTETMKIIKF